MNFSIMVKSIFYTIFLNVYYSCQLGALVIKKRCIEDMVEIHKLDAVYYCKMCLRTFLFVGDIEDHQNETGHRGISRIQLLADV